MRRFRIFVGLVLTAVGAVWLVSRLGGVGKAVPQLREWWPIAPVALGMLNLLALIRRPTWLLAPLLLIAGGSIGLLASLDRKLPPTVQPYVWPVVVIVAGVAVALWERKRIEDNDDFIRQTVVLRSRRISGTTADFQHGVVRAYLGNLELDLQRCELSGDAELCVTVLLGHVDLLPPPATRILLQGRRFGPGVEVPTLPPLVPAVGLGETDDEEAEDDSRPNVLKVSVMGFMGGFDLRPVWNPEAAAVEHDPGEMPEDGFSPPSESRALIGDRHP